MKPRSAYRPIGLSSILCCKTLIIALVSTWSSTIPPPSSARLSSSPVGSPCRPIDLSSILCCKAPIITQVSTWSSAIPPPSSVRLSLGPVGSPGGLSAHLPSSAAKHWSSPWCQLDHRPSSSVSVTGPVSCCHHKGIRSIYDCSAYRPIGLSAHHCLAPRWVPKCFGCRDQAPTINTEITFFFLLFDVLLNELIQFFLLPLGRPVKLFSDPPTVNIQVLHFPP